jgi:Glu-tRNA(Gln) amidotransferase subunit E-like FAD-binding protein
VKAAIPEVLRHVSSNPGESVSHAVDRLKLEKMNKEELRKIVEEKKRAGKRGNELIQEIMREHRLRVDMKELSELA